MGLLEDAIREHLELKRLRGADPGEVAREQHEALDQPTGQEPGLQAEDHAPAGETDAAGDGLDADGPTAADGPDDLPESPTADSFSHPGQETAELDMQAVLADEASTADEHEVPADADLAERQAPTAAGEDSLEWEEPASPGRHPDSGPGVHAGQHPEEAAAAEDEAPSESAEELDDGHAGAERKTPGQGRLSL